MLCNPSEVLCDFSILPPAPLFLTQKDAANDAEMPPAVEVPAGEMPRLAQIDEAVEEEAKAEEPETEEKQSEEKKAEVEEEKIEGAEAEVEIEEKAEESQRPRNEARERSRSPIPRDSVAAAFQSYNAARQLDGMPPVSENDPTFRRHIESLQMDEELLADSIVESRLSSEEKEKFSQAKDKALHVWLDNAAWRAAPMDEAQEGEVIPARFLLRWKGTKTGKEANARVIIQGFRHKDVLTEELDRESPTLSRVGKMLLLQWAVQMKWKLFGADVKSAFMQANSIDETTRIYIKPTTEMRRRLERLMDLKPHELLKATKPAFGDVRAPRQWFETADEFLIRDLLFLSHPLDRWVYLSVREAVQEDEEFRCFWRDGKCYIVDGLLGLHVDDFIGCGEGVHRLEDIQAEMEEVRNSFKSRVQELAKHFKFGSWDFGRGSKILFCGTEIGQSMDYSQVTLSLRSYVEKVKPITVEKSTAIAFWIHRISSNLRS